MVKKCCYKNIENKIDESVLKDVDTVNYQGISNMKLKELYIADYDFKVDNAKTYVKDYGLTRYLKRIRKNKLSPTACRLIGKFEDTDEVHEDQCIEIQDELEDCWNSTLEKYDIDKVENETLSR